MIDDDEEPSLFDEADCSGDELEMFGLDSEDVAEYGDGWGIDDAVWLRTVEARYTGDMRPGVERAFDHRCASPSRQAARAIDRLGDCDGDLDCWLGDVL